MPSVDTLATRRGKYNTQPTLVKIYTDTLAPGANKIYQVNEADHLFLYSSTGNEGDLEFSFDSQTPAALLITQVVASFKNFTTVQVINTSAVSVTYTIVVSLGSIDYKGSIIAGTINTNDAASTIKTYAAAGALAATPKRKRVWLFNNTGGQLWIGDTNVAINQGIPIAAGQLIILETSAALTFTGNLIATEENYA